MGGEQAAGVLIQVKEEQLAARGQEMDPTDKEKLKREILEKYEREGAAYYSTARLWDDGIIDEEEFVLMIIMVMQGKVLLLRVF